MTTANTRMIGANTRMIGANTRMIGANTRRADANTRRADANTRRTKAAKVLGFMFLTVISMMGCGYKIDLRVGNAPTASFRTKLLLRVAQVQDLRPETERSGDKFLSVHVFIPLGLFNYGEFRSSMITGNKDMIQNPAAQVQRNLVGVFQASGAFAGVSTNGQAHLEVRTQILHLYGHQYQGRWVFTAAGGGAVVSSNDFPVYGNVALRIQLVDVRGGKTRLLMERVVHGTSSAIASPKVIAIAYRKAVRTALSRALQRAWYWVLGNVREAFPIKNEAYYATWLQNSCGPGRGCTFEVIRISRFHEQVDVLTVSMDNATVLRKRRIHRTSLLITPPGKAGEWLLSPWDKKGFPIPSSYYNAMAKHLALRGFTLRRIDQFSLYHFFGFYSPPPSF